MILFSKEGIIKTYMDIIKSTTVRIDGITIPIKNFLTSLGLKCIV
jgi:hypothetical protein